MLSFMFSWMGGLIFWIIYLVINTITWAIWIEKKAGLITEIANGTADGPDWFMAIMTWIFWPIVFMFLALYFICWFIFKFFIGKIFQLIAKSLLKCIPNISIKFNKG